MIKILCDCCGQTSCEMCPDPEFTECGMVDKRHYCQHAKTRWDEFLLKRDQLHDRIQTEWGEGLEALKVEYQDLGSLPDE